jgi:mono/diheme cytochrome c family protein
MAKKILWSVLGVLGVVGLVANFWLFATPSIDSSVTIPTDAESIARGEYLVGAGGCGSCHRAENSDALSGGYAIDTDFGRFYTPNITPDVATGIGNWSGADFIAALKHGRTPTGSFYYPAFPYRAYAGLSDAEVLDMAAYLMSLDPVSSATPAPDVPAWLQRWMVAGWNKLADFAQPAAEQFDDELVARGAHLARNLAHCGECHTPRNGLGIPDYAREYAGAQLGDEVIEAIDAHALEEWTFENFDLFLVLGMTPEGEFVGGDMNEVIEHNTSQLSDEDRDALAAFFTRHRQE